MKPLSMAKDELQNIRLIASDMDGTMTNNGVFSKELFAAFESLRSAKIRILLITGRSAGWVNGLASLLPIDGAIAENGGIFFPSNTESSGVEITALPNGRIHHRKLLRNVFEALQREFPNIQEAADNCFRITDWTYSVADLSSEDLSRMNSICSNLGWDFTYSNVQCHITPKGQNKANGLLQILQNYSQLSTDPNFVLTVGDSPNDESLFDSKCFPNSVGVSNIQRYIERLKHKPAFITSHPECDGFCEISSFITSSRDSL